jgi:hypothetical protein
VTSQTTIVRNTKLQSRDRVDQRFLSRRIPTIELQHDADIVGQQRDLDLSPQTSKLINATIGWRSSGALAT